MDRQLNLSSNKSERAWSIEALRGSLEVNQPMARSTSSSRRRASAGLSLVQAAAAKLEDSQKTSLARWLDSPGTEDVSPVVSAVSELFSARGDSTTTSPATSCSSSDPSLYARKQSIQSAYHMSPTSPQHVQALRPLDRSGGPSSSSTQPKRDSPTPDLREVGAFATAPARTPQQSNNRRPYRYKPLSTWAGLWISDEQDDSRNPGSDTDTAVHNSPKQSDQVKTKQEEPSSDKP